jgi:hypothetical protein
MNIRALATVLGLVSGLAMGQTSAVPALTAEQQASLASARQDFGAKNFTAALAIMRGLHEQRPDDATITDGTAETAIEAGDGAYATSILKAQEANSPADWRARTFLARAYAESGQVVARDAELKSLMALHASTTDPAFAKLNEFLLERVSAGSGHVDFHYSVQPWSRYNIYVMARVFDGDGKQTYRITLESSDMDQTLFAKDHPDLAAKGVRVFTLDGYSEPQPGPNGTHSQTHATFGFLHGQPTYDETKSRMLAIAAGKNGPMSTTSGIPIPKSNLGSSRNMRTPGGFADSQGAV